MSKRARTHSASWPFHADNLLDQMITDRISALQRRCDDARERRTKLLLAGEPPGFTKRRAAEARRREMAIFGKMRSSSGPWQVSLDASFWAAEEKAIALLRDEIIPRFVNAVPSIPREALITLIRACWPPSSGIGAVPLFEPRKLRAAHDCC